MACGINCALMSSQHLMFDPRLDACCRLQLSMTRALGHNMLADFGVIATPSVVQQQLSPADVCLVVASDGGT